MAFKYNLYPAAEQKLVETGLAKRIKKATEQDDFPNVLSVVFQDELPGMIKDMRERGFFRENSDGLAHGYRPKLEAFFKNKDAHKWVVKKDGKEEKEDSDYEDFMLFSGYLASAVLKPEEFWDFQKFGFSSVFDFFGCIGAYAWKLEHSDNWRRGHMWESSPDGKHFVTQVTGDTNGDFRLFRTDLTPYETLDPLGNPVNYRPEFRSDCQNVCGYHSVEPELLVALMKYVDQEKLLCPLLTPSGMEEIVAELAKKGQAMGNYADFGLGSPWGPDMHFVHYHTSSIPRLDEKTNWNPFGVGIDSEHCYRTYVDENQGLVFQYEAFGKEKCKEIALRLPKDEVPQIIRGLFVQAIEGLGRTSAKQLIDLVIYRFSSQFEKDREEELKRTKPS